METFWRTRSIAEALFASPGDVFGLRENKRSAVAAPAPSPPHHPRFKCEKCGRRDPVIGVNAHANTQGYKPK